MISKSFMLCCVVGTTAVAGVAHAQTGGGAGDNPAASAGTEMSDTPDQAQDIVVTATRGNSSLQSTPMAVTALGGDSLKKLGVNDVQSLAVSVPGVSFGSLIGQSHIAIRGIGSSELNPGVDPRVAYHQDGIYIGRPTAQTGGFFDLERVEVLKGPQGALYGRNATAGAINVISREPGQATSGYATLSYGNYNAVLAEGALGGGIAENLSARISAQARRHDSYGQNIATGHGIDNQKEVNVRASLLWTPAPTVQLRLIGEYHREKDNGGALHYLGQANPAVPSVGLLNGGVIASNPRDIAGAQDPFVNVTTYAGTAIASIDFNWAELKSYTSVRRSEANFGSNIDGTSFLLSFSTVAENADQFSQEFVLSGKRGALEWLVGAQYFHENIDDSQILPFNLAVAGGPNLLAQGYFAGGNLKNTAVAPYARVKLKVTGKASIVLGGRYTVDKREIADSSQFDFSRPYSSSNPIIELPGFPRSAKTTFRQFTPTATIDYQITPRLYSYVSYTKGFKAGGFNLGVSGNAFSPETVDDIEAGIRYESPDRLLRLNATVFHYDYKNLQLGVLRGPVIVIENAAQAKLYGADIEATLRPTEAFQIDGALSLVHSEYRNFVSTNPAFPAAGPVNLEGNQLTQAPKVSGRIGAQYKMPFAAGDLTARGDFMYTSRVFFTPWNEKAVSQNAYGLFNARLTYERDKWSVEAFVENVTNKQYVSQSYVSNILFGLPVLGAYGAPRTFGIKLGYDF